MDENMRKTIEQIETLSVMTKSVGEDFLNVSKEAEKMLEILRDPFEFLMHGEDIDKYSNNIKMYLMIANHKAVTLSKYLEESNGKEGGKEDE